MKRGSNKLLHSNSSRLRCITCPVISHCSSFLARSAFNRCVANWHGIVQFVPIRLWLEVNDFRSDRRTFSRDSFRELFSYGNCQSFLKWIMISLADSRAHTHNIHRRLSHIFPTTSPKVLSYSCSSLMYEVSPECVVIRGTWKMLFLRMGVYLCAPRSLPRRSNWNNKRFDVSMT